VLNHSNVISLASFQESTVCGSAYILINELPHARSEEVDDTRIVDYAADGTVAGIELLYVSDGVDISGLPHESELGKLLSRHHIKVFA
jgi:uncharacterized protein YuzE